MIYLFESNDSEQVEFVKSTCAKIKKCDELHLVPHILMQTKMDLQIPESGENRQMLGQNVASETAIKVYKEISANQNEIAEAIDTIMMIVNEPKRGLRDQEIQAAKEMDSGSELYRYISSSPATAAAIISIAVAGIGLVIYLIKSRR